MQSVIKSRESQMSIPNVKFGGRQTANTSGPPVFVCSTGR